MPDAVVLMIWNRCTTVAAQQPFEVLFSRRRGHEQSSTARSRPRLPGSYAAFYEVSWLFIGLRAAVSAATRFEAAFYATAWFLTGFLVWAAMFVATRTEAAFYAVP